MKIISCSTTADEAVGQMFFVFIFAEKKIGGAKWHASSIKNSSTQFLSDETNKKFHRRDAKIAIVGIKVYHLCKSLNSKAISNCRVKWQTTNDCHRHWLTMLGFGRQSEWAARVWTFFTALAQLISAKYANTAKGIRKLAWCLRNRNSNKSFAIYCRCRNGKKF